VNINTTNRFDVHRVYSGLIIIHLYSPLTHCVTETILTVQVLLLLYQWQ